MKVELIPGIASISGAIKRKDGKQVVFRTFRRPSAHRGSKSETRMYLMERPTRKTPPSEKELAARCRFTILARRATELMEQHVCRTRKEAWQIAKEELKNNEQLGL